MKKQNQSKGKKGKKITEGEVPGAAEKQNLGHNSKKEGLGQNSNR